MENSHSPASLVSATQAALALRAYQIWQDAGCPEGQAQAHWDRAAFELTEHGAAEPKTEKKPVKIE